MGISATTLKRLCRHYGIKRWPFRQISGIDRTVARLEAELEASLSRLPSADMADQVTEHIRELHAHRQDIIEVCIVVGISTRGRRGPRALRWEPGPEWEVRTEGPENDLPYLLLSRLGQTGRSFQLSCRIMCRVIMLLVNQPPVFACLLACPPSGGRFKHPRFGPPHVVPDRTAFIHCAEKQFHRVLPYTAAYIHTRCSSVCLCSVTVGPGGGT